MRDARAAHGRPQSGRVGIQAEHDLASALAAHAEHKAPVILLDLGLPPHPASPAEGLAALSELVSQDRFAAIEVPVPSLDAQQWFDALQQKARTAREAQASAAAELDHLVGHAVMGTTLGGCGHRCFSETDRPPGGPARPGWHSRGRGVGCL